MSALWQATCVNIAGRGVLIEGKPGTGKSSLALALIDRGAVLVGDDGVALSSADGCLIATPAPATRGLLEVRNLGLVEFPCVESANVALVLLLDPQAPRFIEEAATTLRGGMAIPLVRLWPGSPVLALRAELALAKFGLV